MIVTVRWWERLLPFLRRDVSAPDWERSTTRPRHGFCPECAAPEDRFCFPGCQRADLHDWRGWA